MIDMIAGLAEDSPAATPIRRNITIEDVGNVAAFLLSDLAAGVSAEIMYVDGGINTTAMGNPDPLPG